MQTPTAKQNSLSAFDNKRYICLDCLSTSPLGHYSWQSYVESDGDGDSLIWFDPNQPDSQISWDFIEVNLSELFKDSQVNLDFESNALPPPAKRMRKYCSEIIYQLLENASNYSPPDPGLINASNIRDEDIPADQISVCYVNDFETSESSGEQ